MLGLTASNLESERYSLVAGEVVGLGVSMTLTRCSPLIATFWGVCMWKEAEGMSTGRNNFWLRWWCSTFYRSCLCQQAHRYWDAGQEAGDC